jgi:hypothetical protein
MTAFAPFPPAAADTTADHVPRTCAEARLAAAVLQLGPQDAAARLAAAFGPAAAVAILAARTRLGTAATASADAQALTRIAAASIHGPDGTEDARALALDLVPAHRMEPLVLAARDFALTLRRAVLQGQGRPPCPHAAPPDSAAS